jgi:hypothetical protein
MKKVFLLLLTSVFTITIFSQSDNNNQYQNTAEKLTVSDSKLTIGGYGEVHYNQVLSNDIRNNGILDVHRMVMFFGYNFSDKTQFVSEVEFEYAKELWVEQVYVQHKLNNSINVQAGLMLIPMGIVNLYHEPVTFNGVERPIIDNKIAPSTWREVGVGINGNILPLSMKYQLMLVNGPVSYDGTAGLLNGSKGIREGRQKGSKSYMSSPNLAGRLEYFGLSGLNLGLSGYYGKSQSKLYDKISLSNTAALAKADSSVVDIAMVGADARYQIGGFQARGQFYYAALGNTDQYNALTRKSGVLNDLGSSMYGYYVEAGYNVLRRISAMELVPFVRYQQLDTHLTVASNITAKDKYKEDYITAGLTLKLTPGVVVKTDVDFGKTAVDAARTVTFNAGVGVMF